LIDLNQSDIYVSTVHIHSIRVHVLIWIIIISNLLLCMVSMLLHKIKSWASTIVVWHHNFLFNFYFITILISHSFSFLHQRHLWLVVSTTTMHSSEIEHLLLLRHRAQSLLHHIHIDASTTVTMAITVHHHWIACSKHHLLLLHLLLHEHGLLHHLHLHH